MRRIIGEYGILILCLVTFLLFIFTALKYPLTWSSMWQTPGYQMNTFKMIMLNLPWVGVSFYHFVKMRTSFKNSFILTIVRLGVIKRICWRYNVRLLGDSVIVVILYVGLAQIIAVVLQGSWLGMAQWDIWAPLLMVILTFSIGLSQLVISISMDTRVGLLVQLCYSLFSIIVARLLVLNGHVQMKIQIFFWPQWLTTTRLLSLHYSGIMVVMSIVIVIFVLEFALYVAVRQKDWLG